ncbi:FAR1 DNA binding domain-containing protein [Artemisia annua]|uniref:FAR1 DNA binding domain-containing protein n=1 Tax=Artemisia annua TaxID=35608 RepID=A0A2U1KI41_ARTAN|nr:FAR1 DNA binding domain-containing protein [Artemisia annua]
MDLPDQYFGIGPNLSHHSLSKNAVEGDLMMHNSASFDLVDDVNLSTDDNVEDNDEVNSIDFFTLNSRLYKLVVIKAVVPKEGSSFDSFEDVYKVYKNYAAEAGFIVRRGHESKAGGIIVNKEFVFSKEGIKRVKLKEFDSLKQDCDDKKVKRKRYEFRTNCKARLYVIKSGDKYMVKTFVEDHNHGFFTAEDRYLQKSHRSMSVAHQYFAIKASNLNIGPCMSFNFIAELLGGYENIGSEICEEEGFKKRLCRIVWRESDEPKEFINKEIINVFFTRTGKPQLKTRQAVEVQAAEFFTLEAFYLVQIEIVASVDSCTGSMKNLGYVKDTDKEWYGEFKVDYDEESHSVKCSCLHFERRGLLCRHAFYTLRANSIKKIPKQYLLRRWRKEAVVLPPLGSSYKTSGSSGSSISKVYSKVNEIINQCGYDEEKLSKFLEQLSVYESELESSTVPQNSPSKEQSLSFMIGILVPPVVEVFPPNTGKTKGGISGHRYKPSNNDTRIKDAKEDHDFRNCPNNPNRKKLNPKKVIKKTNRKQKTKKNQSSKANSKQGADVSNFSSEEDSDC